MAMDAGHKLTGARARHQTFASSHHGALSWLKRQIKPKKSTGSSSGSGRKSHDNLRLKPSVLCLCALLFHADFPDKLLAAEI